MYVWQGGDATFSHQHGETDAAPGTINTVGRGSQGGYRPSGPDTRAAVPAIPPQQSVGASVRDPREVRVAPRVAPPVQPPMPAQPVAPGGQPYGLDQKAAYEAKREQERRDEERMMGLPNTAASHPCTSCVPKGGPPE